MNKEIKDYLHLYLGCEVTVISSNGRGGLVTYTDILTHGVFVDSQSEHPYIKQLKPILRPLSGMTEEEHNIWDLELHGSGTSDLITYEAERTKYLLSKHFDLFGLIESGLAIDKTNQE